MQSPSRAEGPSSSSASSSWRRLPCRLLAECCRAGARRSQGGRPSGSRASAGAGSSVEEITARGSRGDCPHSSSWDRRASARQHSAAGRRGETSRGDCPHPPPGTAEPLLGSIPPQGGGGETSLPGGVRSRPCIRPGPNAVDGVHLHQPVSAISPDGGHRRSRVPASGLCCWRRRRGRARCLLPTAVAGWRRLRPPRGHSAADSR